MKLIVGLGNPGEKYQYTRHNVGFMAVDNLAKSLGVEFKLQTGLKAFVAVVNQGGHKAILIKPVTFMNLSGDAVFAVMKYYKIAVEDILVINDDLDLPCGKVRFRQNGSAGGHNGLKSINERIGTQEYKRIKIGIDRSPVIPVVDYVLGVFSKDDIVVVNQAIYRATKACEAFIREEDILKISSAINQ